MLQTHVNGIPFLFQDADEVDDDGLIREAIWQAVEDSNIFFRSMLSGSRWLDGTPISFAIEVKLAKDNILVDLNTFDLESRRARIFHPAITIINGLEHNSMHDILFPDYSLANACVGPDSVDEDSSEHLEYHGISYFEADTQTAYPDTTVFIEGEPDEHRCNADPIAPFPTLSLGTNVYRSCCIEDVTGGSADYNQCSLPFTPANPYSDSESDSVSAKDDVSDDASDDMMSEARDPFRDSPYHMNSADQDVAADHSIQMTVSPQESLAHSPMPNSLSPSPLGMRRSLSARIQCGVNSAMAGLEDRITKLEDLANASHEKNLQHGELVAKLTRSVEAILTAVDAAIERMENRHGEAAAVRANSI